MTEDEKERLKWIIIASAISGTIGAIIGLIIRDIWGKIK